MRTREAVLLPLRCVRLCLASEGFGLRCVLCYDGRRSNKDFQRRHCRRFVSRNLQCVRFIIQRENVYAKMCLCVCSGTLTNKDNILSLYHFVRTKNREPKNRRLESPRTNRAATSLCRKHHNERLINFYRTSFLFATSGNK